MPALTPLTTASSTPPTLILLVPMLLCAAGWALSLVVDLPPMPGRPW